jgi:hypothetical protein
MVEENILGLCWAEASSAHLKTSVFFDITRTIFLGWRNVRRKHDFYWCNHREKMMYQSIGSIKIHQDNKVSFQATKKTSNTLFRRIDACLDKNAGWVN